MTEQPLAGAREWTAEQLHAIERRAGDLLLDAGAGSGKTSVLVERFVRAVLEDGVDVTAILTITFTDKAAAEMRDRIRARLRELGAVAQARATEGAFISTIHGFCARLLRTHALAAGLDPGFEILDESDAHRLATAAFDDALEGLAGEAAAGVELIASYGTGALRAAILSTFAQLRCGGELEPELPPLAPLPDPPRAVDAREVLRAAAAAAASELGALADPSTRVVQALHRLARVGALLQAPEPWPGDIDALGLPGGNGAALTTPVCVAYGEALQRLRLVCEYERAAGTRELLDRLLHGFGARYAQRKRACSAIDFEDLELLARELLRGDPELRERYRVRFAQIMVDELQDTNAVQLELIESIAAGNLFTVGDAQQSIYGFRHADVELFEQRGRRLERDGARASLQTNFRSRPALLEVLNATFAPLFGERFLALRPGRADVDADADAPAPEPAVELLVADKGADWTTDGLGSPWRVAEARALAARVAALIGDGGARPRDVVVLTRATTDLRAYERALEQQGVPTYVIGGRGYWAHPQVVDLVCYLRALANPRDEEALYGVLASPLVGVSDDALVLLAAASRALRRDPWWTLQEPDASLDELAGADRERLAAFAPWFAAERAAAARTGIEQLVERALTRSGYDLVMLALPGGARRLANVRKLMRLGREFEVDAGPDLRGFLELVAARSSGFAGSRDARESEAPVEGEALDAVRLMTIHRAKGLEFEIVCVADLGRSPRRGAELLRVGRDRRLGLRLSEPGTGRMHPALAYRSLGEQQLQAEDREERRLFYVAMTRARERLILSGAARLDAWPERGSPIAWIGPALIPEITQLAQAREDAGERPVRLRFIAPGDGCEPAPASPAGPAIGPPAPVVAAEGRLPAPAVVPEGRLPVAAVAPEGRLPVAPAIARLSYSSLHEYERCGYRFYAERVLGLPAVTEGGGGPVAIAAREAPPANGRAGRQAGRAGTGAGAGDGLTATERGVVAHALLERLDFRRPQRPSAEAVAAAARRAQLRVPAPAQELAQLIERFGASELCARLARAREVRREQPFSFLLAGGVLVTGALDVLAREPPGRMLIVDYKSDRLDGCDPAAVVDRQYATQRLIYALATLRAGAAEVEVVHVFLERVDEPAGAAFTRAAAPALERALAHATEPLLRGEFAVAQLPQRSLCNGCPAEGGLCSWPLEVTRRASPDCLF
ncbi:MAG: UvrD-helicase domain-containing protein [Solirubrobacteraceae bacterium]